MGLTGELLNVYFMEVKNMETTMNKVTNLTDDMYNRIAKDVFKYVQNGREVFYVVINPMDDKMALCYSIYPC